MNCLLNVTLPIAPQLEHFINDAIKEPDACKAMIEVCHRMTYNLKNMTMKYNDDSYPLDSVLMNNILVIHNIMTSMHPKDVVSDNKEMKKPSKEKKNDRSILFKSLSQQQQSDILAIELSRKLRNQGYDSNRSKEVIRGLKLNNILLNKSLKDNMYLVDGKLNIDIDISQRQCTIRIL